MKRDIRFSLSPLLHLASLSTYNLCSLRWRGQREERQEVRVPMLPFSLSHFSFGVDLPLAIRKTTTPKEKT